MQVRAEDRTVGPLSEAGYFALDDASEDRWEYRGGYATRMDGESLEHTIVKMAVARALGDARPDCLSLPSGLRVQAPAYGKRSYGYPDVVLVCGDPVMDPRENPALLRNPTFLVEVLSESTRLVDTGEKRDAYLRIESLVEYWVLDPLTVYLDQYWRTEEGAIILRLYRSLDEAVVSETLGTEAGPLRLPMDRLYRGASWIHAGDSEGG